MGGILHKPRRKRGSSHEGIRRNPIGDAGVDTFAEDWGSLLILDACRYDMFEEVHDLPGELETQRSRGSSTKQWLRRNLDERILTDTVYVTANPQFYLNRCDLDVNLHDTINVWREDGWDGEFRAVRPETVTEAAIDAAREYPNKRLMVHYIQPHYPFIGPTGQEHFDLDSLAFWKHV